MQLTMAIDKANNPAENPIQHQDSTISHLWVKAVTLACNTNAAMKTRVSRPPLAAGEKGEDKCNLTKSLYTVTENPNSKTIFQTKRGSVKYEMSRTPHFMKSPSLLKKARYADRVNYQNNSNKSSKSFTIKHHRDFMGNNLGECGESIIWLPKNREDWVESIDEMTNLCHEAALRSAALQDNKKLDTPLSKEYIRDRIDIDDPLRGFQIRHKYGGWMQGFILTTTFTTWTHYFKWDSKHPQSGMVGNTKARVNDPGKPGWDSSGNLARELEKQHRSGDPVAGVVWHNVAEISLVGGLGCGEYLLRMALDDIAHQNTYEFVVLQATPSSLSFYEKFGFVRVGAVAKYSNSRVVGYRHWAYAHESNLNYHGGPSYMMARKVRNDVSSFSFLDAMKPYIVPTKPVVMPQVFDTVSIPYAFPYIHTPVTKKRDRESKFKSLTISPAIKSRDDEVRRIPSPKETKGNSEREACVSTKRPRRESCSTPQLIDAPPTRPNKMSPLRSKETNITPVVSPQMTCSGPLRKQRVTDVYRDSTIERFFSKVIAKRGEKRTQNSFFFVVKYAGQAEAETLHVVPLEPRGEFAGKRIGRTKYRSIKGADVLKVSAGEWEVVKADMVTKTAVVANESWDIKENIIPSFPTE